MMNLKTCALMICILMLHGIGGSAYGQCVADGNDTEADATPIGYIETVSDWVCPDDLFDYYTLEIDPGASVSGTITFESAQSSTVLRVYHTESGIRLVNDIFTNDMVHQLTIPVSMNNAQGGIYYARVFYWSEAAFDHEYTLTLDLEVTGVSQLEFGRLEAKPLVTQNAPWPSPGANPRNSCCAKVAGPGSDAVRVAYHDLAKELDLENDPDLHGFRDLMIGPDNRAYFRNEGTNALYAWDLMTGYLWDFPIADLEKPIFSLDDIGSVYVIGRDGVRLFKLDPNGNEVWSRRIVCTMGYGTALWPVGDYVCVSTIEPYPVVFRWSDLDGAYLNMWHKNGNEILKWEEVTNQRKRIDGVAQGFDKSVYVLTSSRLKKYNDTGELEWDHYLGAMTTKAHFRGVPVIGEDGRTWVNYEAGNSWKVFNPDGTIYKEGRYSDNDDNPKTVCVGGDGRLYAGASHGKLICYDDWDQEVWRVGSPIHRTIEQIIWDSHGFIYMLYRIDDGTHDRFHWATVDPDDGEILFDHLIVQPTPGDAYWRGEIAKGDNGYLVYLHECGFLGVYGPALRMETSELEYRHTY